MNTIIGHHACRLDQAQAILRDRTLWEPSRNAYDWLGDGIYFWENSLRRAREWARNVIEGPAAILRAEIELGRCLDLSDTEYLNDIKETYSDLVELYRKEGWTLPQNRDIPAGSRFQRRLLGCLDASNRWVYRKVLGLNFRRTRDQKLRYLDRLVINRFLREPPVSFQTVRCPFEEGEPIFPGSAILDQTHVQVSVRDPMCISNISLEEE